jgi:putative DNA methylase
MKAIEVDFPFEQLDAIADIESKRKETNRPIYHIHKWWARRLGSVFRAIVLGVTLDEDKDIWAEYYKTHDFENTKILDPFMGSGTTIGECAKLGIKPIGCDTNPISTFMVSQALTRIDKSALLDTFYNIEFDVKDKIQSYYKTIDPVSQETCNVLYYFWVKMFTTPNGETIPLFKRYVFSKSVYPQKHPQAQIICPSCWTVNTGVYNALRFKCHQCHKTFNPQKGTVTDQVVISRTGKRYKIKEQIQKSGTLPNHRLYAIMALDSNGKRTYLTPTDFDHQLFAKAQQDFQTQDLLIPTLKLNYGYSTKPAMGYGYLYWHQFFNERQLLCLSILLKRLLQIPDPNIKEHFLCLFSSVLSFNNGFCMFKGENTGAVRNSFYHSILNFEKTPLENCIWGNKIGSGTFASFFKSKLLNAQEYLDAPFEIRAESQNRKPSQKAFCNAKLDIQVVNSYNEFAKNPKKALILNGNSAQLPLPDQSVDAIVTDPPYFDVFHYSQLSDFFYAWLQPALKDSLPYFNKENCSDPGEVQDEEPTKFAHQLTQVFLEGYRVLKDNGLMVFSFHHVRFDAWLAIYQAIVEAQFLIVASYPVKSEATVNKPRITSKEMTSIDAILVCKKNRQPKLDHHSPTEIWAQADNKYKQYCNRFANIGRVLSKGDKYVILTSQILVQASLANLDTSQVLELLEKVQDFDFSQPEPVKQKKSHLIEKKPPKPDKKQIRLPF